MEPDDEASQKQDGTPSVYGSNLGLGALPLSDGVVQPWEAATEASRDVHPFQFAELERYQGTQLLGIGGMGQVSAVTDLRLNRQVALKEVANHADDPAGLERRLAQEAWITAQLEHPGIVPVYDAGRKTTGRLFFTMRLIRGRSLAQTLEDGDLTQPALLRHFLAVCQAMAYAHSQAVVHRDLKPANIMIGAFGETQVMDWGLARQTTGADADPASGGAPPLVPAEQAAETAAGARVGTPAYMSPEQANLRVVGPASDVWSLGAILFELLDGKPLFEGKSSAEIYDVLSRGPLPALSLAVAPDLAAIVAQALSLDPALRYADAELLADDIAAYLDGRRVEAHDYTAWDGLRRFGRTFALPLLVGAAALVSLAVVFGLSYSQTLDERDRARDAEDVASRALQRAQLAETGEDVAQRQAEANFAARLIVKASDAMRRGHQAEAEVLAAHAVARWDSAFARGVLARFSLGGRPQQVTVAAPHGCRMAAVSPDGGVAMCRTKRDLLAFATDGTALWTAPSDHNTFMIVDDTIALSADVLDKRPARVIDLKTGATLGHLPPARLHEAVSAPGRVLFAVRQRLVLWSAATHQIAGLPGPTGGPRALSGDGRVALVFDKQRRPRVPQLVDTQARTVRALTGLTDSTSVPTKAALNRDGSRIALGNKEGHIQVISAADGTVLWRRVGVRRPVRSLSWSPDGAWLAALDDQGYVDLFEAGGRGRLGFPRLKADHVAWRGGADGLEFVTIGEEFGAFRMPATFAATRFEMSGGISRLALSGDGRTVALGGGDGAVRMFDIDGHLLARRSTERALLALGLGFWGGSKRELAYSDGPLQGLLTLRPDGTTTSRRAAGLGHWILPAEGGGVVAIDQWGELVLHPISGEGNSVKTPDDRMLEDAAASADGKRFAMLSMGETVSWTEMRDGKLVGPKVLLEAPGMSRIALDGGGKTLVLGGGRRVRVLDGETGTDKAVLEGAPTPIAAVAIARDGAWVAAGTTSGEVVVWDAAGRLRMVGRSQREAITGLTFGPSGRWMLSASEDGTAIRWGLNVLDETGPALVRQRTEAWGIGLDHALTADLR